MYEMLARMPSSSVVWVVTLGVVLVACVGDSGQPVPDASTPDTSVPDSSVPEVISDAPLVCEAGTADCNPAVPGCETNLESDDHNCGACGYDCGGTGLCSKGVCQPMVILGKLASPIALTVNGPSVFWYVDGEVDRCPIAGCGSASGVGYGIHVPPYWKGGSLYLNADSTTAWWPGWTTVNSTQSIYYCSVAGCGGLPPVSTNANGDNYSTEMAGNTNFLYWVNGNNGTLTRIRKLDRNVTNLNIPYLTALAHVAADDAHVLITDTSGPPNGGGVYVCFDPTTDCTGGFTKLLDTATLVTTNGTGTFVTQGTNIVECDYPSCSATATPVATGEHPLAAMTADASGVYWATKDGSIRACLLPGCKGGIRTYASSQGALQAITTDASFIYWASLGVTGDAGTVTPQTGSIVRVRK